MKFTKRFVEGIESTDKRQVFFDDDFTGFALRVSPSGRKTFYLSYRAGKGRGAEKKWFMLGTYPQMTVEQAREKAKAVAAKVHQGEDPAQTLKEDKAAMLMKDALPKFLEDHAAKLKPKSAELYRCIVEKYLLPAMGQIKVKAITRGHIAKLHKDMEEKPYMANRTVQIASVFFNWCEDSGYRERASNPCQRIKRYEEQLRKIFMGEPELSLLGDAITKMEGTLRINPLAAAAVRLLLLTGARLMEVLSLRWEYIDFEKGVAFLPDSKTGFKTLQFSAPALAVLEGLPRFSEWIFPADSASGHMMGLQKPWAALMKEAGLSGWRIHDLRHAFASAMVNSGASLPIVGKILGHNNVATTARYAHLQENPARKAAEDAAAKIAKALHTKPKKGKVVAFNVVNGDIHDS